MSTARQQANDLLALLRREHHALAEFLSALAAFDRRGAWRELGHGTLFAFLVKDLGLSNGAAAYRKAAVELVQRFPRVLDHLRTGELCLTTVFELSKVVTEENASEVIPRFFGASRRDAKNVVAEPAPVPAPERTVVTAVPAPAVQVPALALDDRVERDGLLPDELGEQIEKTRPIPELAPVTSAARSLISHHLAQHEQNQKHDEQSDGHEDKAQAWIVRSLFDDVGRGVADFLYALYRFFHDTAGGSGSAMQSLTSSFRDPVRMAAPGRPNWRCGNCWLFRLRRRGNRVLDHAVWL